VAFVSFVTSEGKRSGIRLGGTAPAERWNTGVPAPVLHPLRCARTGGTVGEAIFAGGAPSTSAPPGAGIFKSIDGGSTWSQLSSTAGWSYVTDLAPHPSSANTLYAATEGPIGVFRSTDGGESWTQVLTPATTAVDLEIHPTSPGRVYVGCSARGGSFGAVYRATDGVTFSPLAIGGASNLPANAGRCEVELASGNTVYVQVDKNGGEVRLARTGDHALDPQRHVCGRRAGDRQARSRGGHRRDRRRALTSSSLRRTDRPRPGRPAWTLHRPPVPDANPPSTSPAGSRCRSAE
jgi:hypothetical protein